MQRVKRVPLEAINYLKGAENIAYIDILSSGLRLDMTGFSPPSTDSSHASTFAVHYGH